MGHQMCGFCNYEPCRCRSLEQSRSRSAEEAWQKIDPDDPATWPEEAKPVWVHSGPQYRYRHSVIRTWWPKKREWRPLSATEEEAEWPDAYSHWQSVDIPAPPEAE